VKVERSLGEARNALEDAVRGLDPDEGLGVGVAASDVSLDGSTQFMLGAMTAAAQLSVGEAGEPSFDLVEPRCVSGGEVQLETRMALKPSPHARSLVR
jgi:hypothetical protein